MNVILSLLQYNKIFPLHPILFQIYNNTWCLFAILYVCGLFSPEWLDWFESFLLAPFWPGVIFGNKNNLRFGICFFQKSEKIWFLFIIWPNWMKFLGHNHLTQKCNTNKFFDLVSGFLDLESINFGKKFFYLLTKNHFSSILWCDIIFSYSNNGEIFGKKICNLRIFSIFL